MAQVTIETNFTVGENVFLKSRRNLVESHFIAGYAVIEGKVFYITDKSVHIHGADAEAIMFPEEAFVTKEAADAIIQADFNAKKARITEQKAKEVFPKPVEEKSEEDFSI